MKLSGSRIAWGAGIFLAMLLLVNNLPDDARMVVLPAILIVAFVWSAMKAPPIAIAILLYYSMILGGWLILLAAPTAMLLARRYQRQRMHLPPSPEHLRRSLLFATAALVATLPFIAASLGPWSSRTQPSASRSASPLVPEQGQGGSESAFQRFARWLGFGDDPAAPLGQGEPVQPVPPPRAQPPDDPFNWWIVIIVLAVVAVLLLAWWLWRRRTPPVGPAFVAAPARPLARLEAVGAQIGRPRAPFEGAITYGRELARQTGDARLAAVGPLVSSEVYQSAFANPGAVDADLAGIEAAPPPPMPTPTLGERIRARLGRLHISATGVFVALLVVAAVVVIGWVLIPRLGDLESDRFESGSQQLQIVPAATQHIVNH